jgi:hypothetical protein
MDTGFCSMTFNVDKEEEAVEKNSKSHTNQKQSGMTRRLQQRSWESPQIRFFFFVLSHRNLYGTRQSYLLQELFKAFVSLSLSECENQ